MGQLMWLFFAVIPTGEIYKASRAILFLRLPFFLTKLPNIKFQCRVNRLLGELEITEAWDFPAFQGRQEHLTIREFHR